MDEQISKKDWMVLTIIGVVLLIGCGLLLWANWNSTTVLGAIGRVCGGLLEFVGGVITFIGIAKGRTLYIFSKYNGEDKVAFWHNDEVNK